MPWLERDTPPTEDFRQDGAIGIFYSSDIKELLDGGRYVSAASAVAVVLVVRL